MAEKLKPKKTADDLRLEDLRTLVHNLQGLLFLDGPDWDPEKEWDSDTLSSLGTLMADFGLTDFEWVAK